MVLASIIRHDLELYGVYNLVDQSYRAVDGRRSALTPLSVRPLAGLGLLHSSQIVALWLEFKLFSMTATPGYTPEDGPQNRTRVSQESSSSFEMGPLLETSFDDSDDEALELKTSEAEVLSADSQSFPEGGLKAWSVVAGAFFMVLPSFGLMNSVGTFEDYWQDNQLSSYTTRDIGWIPSVFVYLGLALGIQIGYRAMTEHFLSESMLSFSQARF